MLGVSLLHPVLPSRASTVPSQKVVTSSITLGWTWSQLWSFPSTEQIWVPAEWCQAATEKYHDYGSKSCIICSCSKRALLAVSPPALMVSMVFQGVRYFHSAAVMLKACIIQMEGKSEFKLSPCSWLNMAQCKDYWPSGRSKTCRWMCWRETTEGKQTNSEILKVLLLNLHPYLKNKNKK